MSTFTSRPLRVFLCHASQDKPAVRELSRRLFSEKWLEPWFDEESLLPGQDFDLEIYKAMRDADVIIICLSKVSVAKEGYVNKEIRRALDVAQEKAEGAIYVIPLRLDDCTPSFERLKQLHWVDYFAERGYEKLLQSLHARAESLKIKIPEKALRTPDIRVSLDTTFANERIELARNKVREWGQRITSQQQWDDHCWHLLGHGLEYAWEAIDANLKYPRSWILVADIYHLIGKTDLAKKCLDKSLHLSTLVSDFPIEFYQYVDDRIKTRFPFNERGKVKRDPAPEWFELKYRRFWSFVNEME